MHHEAEQAGGGGEGGVGRWGGSWRRCWTFKTHMGGQPCAMQWCSTTITKVLTLGF